MVDNNLSMVNPILMRRASLGIPASLATAVQAMEVKEDTGSLVMTWIYERPSVWWILWRLWALWWTSSSWRLWLFWWTLWRFWSTIWGKIWWTLRRFWDEVWWRLWGIWWPIWPLWRFRGLV